MIESFDFRTKRMPLNQLDVLKMPRPIEKHDTIWIGQAAAIEVRDLIQANHGPHPWRRNGIERSVPVDEVFHVRGRRDRPVHWSCISEPSHPPPFITVRRSARALSDVAL